MSWILQQAGYWWREVASRLTIRRETMPIDSIERLQEFVTTRATYVAQKTLFGYVKTRMGTRYPRMFEDATFITSLNIAKVHVFAGCLSDLTVYAVGVALHDQPLGNDARRTLAMQCYEAGVREAAAGFPGEFPERDYIESFGKRLDDTDWRVAALQPENFTASPRALRRWAPIAEDLKKYDGEIVRNSVKFTWPDIRADFRKRVDGVAICAEWTRLEAEAPA